MTIQEMHSTKLAETADGVHDLIKRRWSPRAFSGQPVSSQQIRVLLEAARWAPSSSNEQPWRFVVATKADPAKYQALLDVLVPGNQVWAQYAPVLLFTAAKRTTSAGEPNYYALHDTGQALGHLMLQAVALGLHAHAMAGFDHEKARKTLGIPDDFALGAAVAVGHEGSLDQLGEKHRQLETAKRKRKPLSELVFDGTWNAPASF